jgi:type IV pilus assembly protein PilN
MPRINLLPWRDTQRRDRRVRFYGALIAALVAAGGVAGVSYLMFGSMIDAQEQRNARLRVEIKVLDKEIEEINDLESQKQRFISRMEVIDKLQRARPEVVHLFDELVKAMPDGTYLTAVKQTDSKLRLEGMAQSSTRVSTLMRNIAASQWLRNPELEVVETKKDSAAGSNFVLDAEQVSVTDSDSDSAGGKGASKGKKGPIRTAANGGSP